MPEEPGCDRLATARLKRRWSGHLWGRFCKKHPVPRDEDIIEPHLRIEFIESAAQRRDERVLVPDRHLAADYRNTRRCHRHDERDPMRTACDCTECAYVDVLCKGHASVHAHLAAYDDAGVRLFDQAHRSPFVG